VRRFSSYFGDFKMALNKRSVVQAHSIPWGSDLSPLNVYEYATADAVATVIAAGYFNVLRDDGRIRVNDIVNANCVMGGAADFVRLIFTAVPATGNVTVAINTGASGV
jgi:hypothetical protein